MDSVVVAAIIAGSAGLIGVSVGVIVQYFLTKNQTNKQIKIEKEKLELEKSKMRYGSIPILGQGKKQEYQTPDIFDKEYKAFMEVIDEEDERTTKQVYGLESLHARERMAKIAEEHINMAKVLWPSSETSDAFRCAYHYQLAAYCLSKASRPNDAGWNYHFSAHKYRSLFEWERAGKCYIESARQFSLSSDENKDLLTKRSAKRAVACYREVEEHEEIESIKNEFGFNTI